MIFLGIVRQYLGHKLHCVKGVQWNANFPNHLVHKQKLVQKSRENLAQIILYRGLFVYMYLPQKHGKSMPKVPLSSNLEPNLTERAFDPLDPESGSK